MPTMTPPPPIPGPGPRPRPRPTPYFRPYVIVQQQSCKPVYNNQSTLDALNGLLANCDTLRQQGISMCNQSFKDAVQKELTSQLNKAVFIGNSCTNVVPTTRVIY